MLGGTFTAIKTAGTRIDDMIVKKEAAMKCAFGENPKRCYASKCDSSRMTTAAILREALMKARLYLQKKEAAGDDEVFQPSEDRRQLVGGGEIVQAVEKGKGGVHRAV